MLFWPSGADPFAVLRAGSEGRRYISTRGFSLQRPADSKQPFMFCLLSTVYGLPSIVPLYRVTYAFSAQKPDRFLLILAQWVHFRVKTCFIARHFVIPACVFIYIAGSIFIFNISKGQRVLPRILLP